MNKIRSLLKSYWWIIPLLGLLGYSFSASNKINKAESKLAKVEKTLKDERAAWKRSQVDAKKKADEINAGYKANLKQAEDIHQAELKSFVPVIITNEKVVREYAKTPAGQSQCLDADGMWRFTEARNRALDHHPASAP